MLQMIVVVSCDHFGNFDIFDSLFSLQVSKEDDDPLHLFFLKRKMLVRNSKFEHYFEEMGLRSRGYEYLNNSFRISCIANVSKVFF